MYRWWLKNYPSNGENETNLEKTPPWDFSLGPSLNAIRDLVQFCEVQGSSGSEAVFA